MLLSHAVLFAEARSYLAALADSAAGFDASLEYERVLLQLDHLHGGQVTPLAVVPTVTARFCTTLRGPPSPDSSTTASTGTSWRSASACSPPLGTTSTLRDLRGDRR